MTSWTIKKYLFKLYSQYFIITSAIFMVILIISNAFDVLQKFRSVGLSSSYFWKLAVYKIPYLINEIAPFIGFLSATAFLLRLLDYNELIILLSSGLSIWSVILTPVIATFIFALIILMLVNPIGTYGLKKYVALETRLMHKKQSNSAVIKTGILICDSYLDENRIIQSSQVNLTSGELSNVTILFITKENVFIKRIDAAKGFLSKNKMHLTSVKLLVDDKASHYEFMDVPTNLSVKNIDDSFISPEMISIWDLKSSIEKFVKSGISAAKYQIYYFKQMFKPLLMMAFVFLGMAIIMYCKRSIAKNKIVVIAVVTGFIAYSTIEIFTRVLVSHGLTPKTGTLIPILLIIFLSNFVILHFQEA